jgi:hypothetical protein
MKHFLTYFLAGMLFVDVTIQVYQTLNILPDFWLIFNKAFTTTEQKIIFTLAVLFMIFVVSRAAKD